MSLSLYPYGVRKKIFTTSIFPIIPEIPKPGSTGGNKRYWGLGQRRGNKSGYSCGGQLDRLGAPTMREAPSVF
jgi:hypothetical protein